MPCLLWRTCVRCRDTVRRSRQQLRITNSYTSFFTQQITDEKCMLDSFRCSVSACRCIMRGVVISSSTSAEGRGVDRIEPAMGEIGETGEWGVSSSGTVSRSDKLNSESEASLESCEVLESCDDSLSNWGVFEGAVTLEVAATLES